MELDILNYEDVVQSPHEQTLEHLRHALFTKGIVGLQNIPKFEQLSRAFISAARAFVSLDPNIKNKYAPNRALGETEGYELGAEKFMNKQGAWQIDDKKASYYAAVPDNVKNKWPSEVDLQTPYQALGELIFGIGKRVMHVIGLNETVGLALDQLVGCGRLLHYHKENQATNENPNWCGAHFDHGVFTGLMPAYYFQNGVEIEEPHEAGLYIVPSQSKAFEKVRVDRKDVLLFQVGEFGQLAMHDLISATQHKVCKALNGIERFSFALFYAPQDHVSIKSNSCLKEDERYRQSQTPDGRIEYKMWHQASLTRYLAS